MTDNIHLSKRLKTVASFLPKGALFADIGSDHAYLPCYVCLKDAEARAIAGEVNHGPYKSAYETVRTFQLDKQVEVRLGDGLKILKNDKVNEITIAGMGGSLITNILNQGSKYLRDVNRIIVQPNIGERNVRKWFMENNFSIIQEVILEENNHIYEVIVAERGGTNNLYLEGVIERQLLFGPLLLRQKSSLFLKKWQDQHDKLEAVIHQMNQATLKNNEKIYNFEKELSWIKEVIGNE